MKHAYKRKIGSKEGQDYFVSRLLGPRVFVDIGCSHGSLWNNTFMLEQMGWRGLLFDCDPKAISQCHKTRRSPAYLIDAVAFDFRTCFLEHRMPKLIDYVSFDVDAATKAAISNFPFGEYHFLVMTIEHDLYRGNSATKQAIWDRLAPWPEYRPLVNNVQCRPGKAFEDWIVNTRFLSENVLEGESGSEVLWIDYLDRLTPQCCFPENKRPKSTHVLPFSSDGSTLSSGGVHDTL